MRILNCDLNGLGIAIINKLALVNLPSHVGNTYSNHINIKYENSITFTTIISNNGAPEKLTESMHN